MHVPKHFRVAEPEPVLAVAARTMAGTLVTQRAGHLAATILPLDHVAAAEGPGRLEGHASRANAAFDDLTTDEVLVTYLLSDGYISPGWYDTKQTDPRVVPTWDYVAVEVRGRIALHRDADWIDGCLRRAVPGRERAMAEPWRIDDAPASYIEALTGAIVGIEVHIEAIEVAAKLSQNRPVCDRASIEVGLRRSGDVELAGFVADPSTISDPPTPGAEA